jgi:hypothetical protein
MWSTVLALLKSHTGQPLIWHVKTITMKMFTSSSGEKLSQSSSIAAAYVALDSRVTGTNESPREQTKGTHSSSLQATILQEFRYADITIEKLTANI